MIIFRLHWTLIFAATLSISCFQSNLVEKAKGDTVVAVINGNDVTVKDLKSEVNVSMRQFRSNGLSDHTPEEKLLLKTNGLNKIIQNIILNTEVTSSGIFLTRNEYRDALKEAKKEYQKGSFVKSLEMKGISLEVWEKKFKNNMLIKKLISEVVNSEVSVSDDQLKRYYDAHQSEFQKGEQVRSLHIMVGSENEVMDIFKQLRFDKKDFSVLAQIHSLGPEGPTGGDLGYFEASQMPEEFDGVFGLNVGQISDSIKTPYGYHLFKVIDKKPAGPMTYGESSRTIYSKLLREEQSRAFKKWIVKLRAKSSIKIKHDVFAKIYQ